MTIRKLDISIHDNYIRKKDPRAMLVYLQMCPVKKKKKSCNLEIVLTIIIVVLVIKTLPF